MSELSLSLTYVHKVQRIKVFEFNFWISLFKIILGNTILPEMFEFWKVPLFLGMHATCGICIILGNAILPKMFEFWKVQLFLEVHATCGIRTSFCL